MKHGSRIEILPRRKRKVDVAVSAATIEAEARIILRNQIEGSPWYPNLSEEDRSERINHDVECYWPTMADKATKRLVIRLAKVKA